MDVQNITLKKSMPKIVLNEQIWYVHLLKHTFSIYPWGLAILLAKIPKLLFEQLG